MRPEFVFALIYVLVWRVFELLLSKRNERKALALGARVVENDGMGSIIVVHTLWIVGLIVEELFGNGPYFSSEIQGVALGVYVLSELLRVACIWNLGPRWNVRVIVLDAVAPVTRGPYSWLKHPNYVAVVIGLAALPVALGLPWIAVLIVPLKLLALRKRLRVENEALYGVQT
ncbi:MAG: methyltransferase [Planctomycetota bacterium]